YQLAQYTELPLENIASTHIGDGCSPPSIENTCVQKIAFQESKRRRQRQPDEVAATSTGTGCLCRQSRVAFDPAFVIRPVSIREMQEISLQLTGAPVYLYAFVNKIAFPAAMTPVI